MEVEFTGTDLDFSESIPFSSSSYMEDELCYLFEESTTSTNADVSETFRVASGQLCWCQSHPCTCADDADAFFDLQTI